ncbi:MAG: ATP-grasp domain-containing protein [Gammaproteobacteria bacterium]
MYEHITGGGLIDQAIPPSLAHEGDIMLRALVADLAEAGVEVVTTRDERLASTDLPAHVESVGDPLQKDAVVEACLLESDAVWPIAPEAGGVLEALSEQFADNGRLLLGSRPSALHVASSKRLTARRLSDLGVPVVPTFDPRQSIPPQYSRWVLKPDDGAGCVGTRIVDGADELAQAIADLDPAVECAVQPFVAGSAVSLSLLCREGRAALLACNRQRVAVVNEAFCLLGCVVNDAAVQGEYAAPLAAEIAAALPGLWGYVGVDLLLTDGGAQVLEVNPRLTLSYVGLSSSLGTNAAALVLGLLDGDWPEPDVATHAVPVTVNLEVPYAP